MTAKRVSRRAGNTGCIAESAQEQG